MATDQAKQVDHVDTLCEELLRAGRSQSSRADTLFYSGVILESVEGLLPLVENACAAWPGYPERRRAETLIQTTREAVAQTRKMLEATPAPPPGGALYPDRPLQPASADVAGVEQMCERLARAQQALKRHHIRLGRCSQPDRL
ncbi:hypothetical protein [Streptomyces nigrescens]|uniref:hypothetical protein n=1 Tax=Streptomyces nigrescens TaxID=1920 RepID=UPI0036FBABB5